MLLLACGHHMFLSSLCRSQSCRAYAVYFSLYELYFSATGPFRPDGHSCQMTHVSLK